MNRGLYPAPDEEPPVSVSPTAASLPRADAPLKRCPFCGGKASNQITEDFPESYIYFTQCDVCNTGNIEAMYGSHDESASAWNRRDGEDARIAEAKAQGAAEERARAIRIAQEVNRRVEIDHCYGFEFADLFIEAIEQEEPPS